MKYILVRGGNEDAAIIAERAGWLYGVRHDYTAYSPVHMLDVRWKNYNWADVIEKIKRYQPTMALVPDFESPNQRQEIWDRVGELQALGVPEILVCPKYETAILDAPDSSVIAISVPAKTYAGYIPPLEQIAGRKIHLLGGSPRRQADLIRKVNGAKGVMSSLDANGFVREASRGKFFKYGRWVQLRDKKHADIDLAVDSAINMRRFFESVLQEKQPALF